MSRIRSIHPGAISEWTNSWVRHLYLVVEEGTTHPVKVGKAGNARIRLSALQCGNHRKLVLLAVWEGERNQIEKIERNLHKGYEPRRLVREWYDISADEIFAYVNSRWAE